MVFVLHRSKTTREEPDKSENLLEFCTSYDMPNQVGPTQLCVISTEDTGRFELEGRQSG